MSTYNDELKLVHKFLKEQYSKEFKSNKIKTEDERLRWSHAVQVTGLIAYNYNIAPKTDAEISKDTELGDMFNNTIYEQ